jgi:hypothetical protein
MSLLQPWSILYSEPALPAEAVLLDRGFTLEEQIRVIQVLVAGLGRPAYANSVLGITPASRNLGNDW